MNIPNTPNITAVKTDCLKANLGGANVAPIIAEVKAVAGAVFASTRTVAAPPEVGDILKRLGELQHYLAVCSDPNDRIGMTLECARHIARLAEIPSNEPPAPIAYDQSAAILERLAYVDHTHPAPSMQSEALVWANLVASYEVGSDARHSAELDAIRFLALAEAPVQPRQPKRDEYRGNPLLVLPVGERNDFSFGVGKAKAILAHLDAIRAFVAEAEPANRTL